MTRRIFRYENLIYAAVFFLAFALRLAAVSRAPLSDLEAGLALQAMALARGQETVVGPHPAYLALTTLWMFLFGPSNWTARFWPMLAGSALALLPALFKRQVGRLPALVLGFLLALDPAMLAISQQAGGPALAIFFGILFAGLILARKPALAGIAAGMALLSGPDVWPGLLGVGLALLAGRGLGIFERRAEAEDGPSGLAGLLPGGGADWRRLLWFLLGTLFFAGTLFFFIPRGLSATAGGLASYLQGWGKDSSVPAGLLALSLLVYEFLLLFLGAWGAVVGARRRNPQDLFLLTWFLIALALALLYPARQATGIAWSVLPLAALAARQALRMIDLAVADWLPVFGQAVLSALVLGFLSLTGLSMVNNPQFVNEEEYWIRLAGAAVLLIASTFLIAWGWSRFVAARGFTWGLSFIFLLYVISAAWNTANLSSRSGMDLWSGQQTLPNERLLLDTIDSLNKMAPPLSGGYDVVVVGLPSPALQWSLRNFGKVEYASSVPTATSPAFLITADQPDLALSASYRGQGFLLYQNTGWSLLHSSEWLRWVAFRQAPGEIVLKERIILWARTDLFPGGGEASTLDAGNQETQ